MVTFTALHSKAELFFGPRLYKLIRFVISGGIAMLTNLSSLFVLVHYFGFHYLFASIIAFIISIGVSFSMQKFWTFQDRPTQDIRAQFSRYLAIILMNLALNTAMLYTLADIFGVWYLFAQFISGVVIAFIGYFSYKHFVFTERTTTTS